MAYCVTNRTTSNIWLRDGIWNSGDEIEDAGALWAARRVVPLVDPKLQHGRAVTTRMPTPLRNRFVHLEFEVDIQEWCEWAIRAGIRPELIDSAASLAAAPAALKIFQAQARAPALHDH